MNYTEEDIVKHYGIWLTLPDMGEEWLTTKDLIIFAVTCPRVAEAQKSLLEKYADPEQGAQFEVKEITG